MEFEFDPGKSDQNLAKHGIDFIESQKLWNDSNLLEIPARRRSRVEEVVLYES